MIGKIAVSALLAVSAFGLGSPALADPTPPPPPPGTEEQAPPGLDEDQFPPGPEGQAKLQESGVAAAGVPACGARGRNLDSKNGKFIANGVRIRTGPRTQPSPGCTIVGLGYRNQGVDYYCYAQGQGGTWTYLRHNATGKVGWVKDNFLSGYGSFVPCSR